MPYPPYAPDHLRQARAATPAPALRGASKLLLPAAFPLPTSFLPYPFQHATAAVDHVSSLPTWHRAKGFLSNLALMTRHARFFSSPPAAAFLAFAALRPLPHAAGAPTGAFRTTAFFCCLPVAATRSTGGRSGTHLRARAMV